MTQQQFADLLVIAWRLKHAVARGDLGAIVFASHDLDEWCSLIRDQDFSGGTVDELSTLLDRVKGGSGD